MIAIIDYQMGNLRSVQKALQRVGADATITSDPSEIARANGIATRTLISAARNSSRAVHTGSVWTTDALYREFTGKIRAFADQGVLGVDMETSALMIVAAFRQVELGIILTVSDLVYRNDWPNIFGTDAYQDNCAHMADIVMEAIGELLETTGRV